MHAHLPLTHYEYFAQMSDYGWQGSIDNLLINCIGARANQHLLIVEEPEGEHLYDRQLGGLIADRAEKMGLHVAMTAPELVSETADIPGEVSTLMCAADHTLFLSRIGDIARFTPLSGNGSKTICYARNLSMLDSFYASSCHKLMSTLLDRLENDLSQAECWQIQCPLGTDISGTFNRPDQRKQNEFSLSLFPVTTFAPIDCASASGKVALSRCLVPGAAEKMEGHYLRFNGIVIATVESGKIEGFTGETDAVKSVEAHYDRVSDTLSTTRNRVHSWHAGMNPHTFFEGNFENDLEGWNTVSFSSPRYLHFHTCGDLAPCEVTWSVFNPTVIIDGEPFWKDGQFCWLQRPLNRQLIIDSGQSQILEPSASIGF